LNALDLHACNVDELGLKDLVNCPKLNNLSVSGNSKVTDSAMKYVNQMKNLQFLDLLNTKVTVAGLAQLKDLKHLIRILISDTYVTPKAALALNRKIPTLRIEMRTAKSVDKDVARMFAPLK